MTKIHWMIAGLLLIAAPVTGRAETPLPFMPTQIVDCQSHDHDQEKTDLELAQKGIALFNKSDVDGLHRMMPDILAAAAHAPDKPALPENCDGQLNIYTNNMSEFLMASSLAGNKTLGIKSVVMFAPLPYANLYFLAGWTAFEDKNVDQAMGYYKKGMLNDPHDANLASEYANAMETTGHSDEALPFVETFLADNANLDDGAHALMLRRRGYALGDLGRHQEAIDTYNESLKYAPGNKVALSEITWNQQQLGLQH